MIRHTLSRISHIVRANVNEVLDQFEDPEKMVRQMVRDMEHDIDRVAAAVGTAVAGRMRLQREQDARQQRSRQLQDRAREALDTGDEPLARQLLERRVLVDAAAVDLEPALQESEATVARLRQQLDSLREELAEARQRQASLVASLRARRDDRRTTGDTAARDPQAEVQRLEQRLRHDRGEFERLRQRLELDDMAQVAAEDLRRDLDGSDPVLDRDVADMEMRKRVDQELADLRGSQEAQR